MDGMKLLSLLLLLDAAFGVVIIPGSSPLIFDTLESATNFTSAEVICASFQGKFPGEEATRQNLANNAIQDYGARFWVNAVRKDSTTFTFDVLLPAEVDIQDSDSMWGDGEPNNFNGAEDCVEYWLFQNGINDVPCDNSSPRSVLCEPSVPLIISGSSPEIFDAMTTSTSFDQAKSTCEAFNAKLLGEQALRQNIALIQGYGARFWLNAERGEFSPSVFVFDLGHLSEYGLLSTDTLWNANEPNNAGGAEDCLEFVSGGLNDGDCDDSVSRNVICQSLVYEQIPDTEPPIYNSGTVARTFSFADQICAAAGLKIVGYEASLQDTFAFIFFLPGRLSSPEAWLNLIRLTDNPPASGNTFAFDNGLVTETLITDTYSGWTSGNPSLNVDGVDQRCAEWRGTISINDVSCDGLDKSDVLEGTAIHDQLVFCEVRTLDSVSLAVVVEAWFQDQATVEGFYGPISSWNTSLVTDFSRLFEGRTSFDADISLWDTSAALHMDGMFAGTSFNQNIASWDVSSVLTMSKMFMGNTAFNQPIGGWNVSSATDLSEMFSGSTAFDQDISAWNVTNVVEISNMILGASSFPGNSLCPWGVVLLGSNAAAQLGSSLSALGIQCPLPATGDDFRRVVSFLGTGAAVEVLYGDIETWNTSQVTDMSGLANSYYDTAFFDFDFGAWDTSNVVDMSAMFEGSAFYSGTGLANFETAKVRNMSCMFKNAERFDAGDTALKLWDTGSVVDMSEMFAGTIFSGDVSDWDTSKVVSMRRMFTGSPFNNNISAWDVGNVTDMSSMFAETPFDQAVGDWNVGQVEDMSGMFENSAFNKPIGNWQVGSVKSMARMFSFTPFNGPIGAWDVRLVTDMAGMFDFNTNFDQPIQNWNVSSVVNMQAMFRNAADFNRDIGSWLIFAVQNFQDMFLGATSFSQNLCSWSVNPLSITQLDELNSGGPCPLPAHGDDFRDVVDLWFSNQADVELSFGEIGLWDTSQVTDMSGGFKDRSNFNSDISSWDTGLVSSMAMMFSGASSFDQDLTSWDTNTVSDMSSMFQGAGTFNGDISTWNTGEVVDFSAMFSGAQDFNVDISSWTTTKATDLSYMFANASRFQADVSSWDVSSVTNMSFMFADATTFDVDVGNWDVSSVTDMSSMFAGASQFDQDLSHWSVQAVTTFLGMFQGAVSFDQNLCEWGGRNYLAAPAIGQAGWFGSCPLPADGDAVRKSAADWFADPATLEALYGSIASWNTTLVTDVSRMFAGRTSFNEEITSWDLSRVTNASGMFAGASAFNQPIGDWKTSSIQDFSGMFEGASSFNRPLNNWQVSSARDMSRTFHAASSFNQPLNNWKVSGVRDMSSMFSQASDFDQDISSWDVSAVTRMTRMFFAASSFNQDLSGWNVTSVTDFQDIFTGSAMQQDLCTWATNPNAMRDIPSASQTCAPSGQSPSTTSIPLIAGGAAAGVVALAALALGVFLLFRRNQTKNKLLGELLQRNNFSGFLSHYKKEGGPTASLLRFRMEKELDGAVPFLDVENLDDLSTLLSKVVESKALVVILTKSYLRRPFCLAELVAAHQASMLIIPVQVRGIDREFDFDELIALDENNMGLLMDDLGWRILEDQKISRSDVWAAIKRLREIIALPFSPNASAAVQSAEIDELLNKIRLEAAVARADAEQASVAISVEL